MNQTIAHSLIVVLALASCKARKESAAVKTNANVTGDGRHLGAYWSVATVANGETYHCWYSLFLEAKEVRAAQQSDEDIAIAEMVKQLNAVGRSNEIQAEVMKIKQKKLPTVEQKVAALFRKSDVAHPKGVTLAVLKKSIESKDRWQNSFIGGGDALTGTVGFVLWAPIRYLAPKDSELGRATIAAVSADEKDSAKVRSDVDFSSQLMDQALATVGHSSSSPVECKEPIVVMSSDKEKMATIQKEIASFATYIQTVKLED